MFRFFLSNRLFLSALITFVVLLLTVFQDGKKPEASLFQSVVQSSVYPFQSGFHSLKTWSNELYSSYVFLQGVEQENRRLKQEVSDLKKERNKNIEEALQFRRLRKQMDFAQTSANQLLFAEIIGESVDNTYQTITINRGSIHGVKHNAPVILQEGIVGRVQSVSAQEASVQIILDRRSIFPAIDQRSRVKGMLTGTHSGIELRRIHPRADIRVGDRIVSNGFARLFPKGLFVGTVVSIEHKNYELFKTARLEPALDFRRMEEVFVVLKEEKALEEALPESSETPKTSP